jgi:hypothetical protein
MSIEGAVDTQGFDAYVEHFLTPSLPPGDIALLDNGMPLGSGLD